ncbi:MAG: hypothetical protein ACRDGD_12775 [Candidatus Limnocylindria bacterium]
MPSGGREAVSAESRPRLTERHVLALGLSVSAIFVLLAALVAVATILRGGSQWAAMHLALAGAATVAIGAFMPHFAVTLAGTRPAPPRWRLAALGLLALGAAAAVLGVALLAGGWAAFGAASSIAGLAVVAAHTFAPLREPLARRHHVVSVAYGVALVEMALGMLLGALGALGIPEITAAWGSLRPAHAWLTLFGAVSLTIFATLVYLAPTVLGARIRLSRSLAAATVGMVAGPPVATIGFMLALAPVVMTGAGVILIGAIGQIGFLLDVYRRRGPFRSEHDWRRVSVWHMGLGAAWFAGAVAAALGGLIGGHPVVGWSIGLLAIPMVGGWMLQELVGSWTYLVPSVTPGDAEHHAAQRRILAVASRSRLGAWNAGVALAWLGLSVGATAIAVGGAVLVGICVVTSVAILARALTAARY